MLELYEFQRQGVDWLKHLATNGQQGGILADSMGLGKTVQVLKAIDELCYRRCLIVTLNSTRSVWSTEIDKWVPHLKYSIIDAYQMDMKRRVQTIKDKSNVLVIVNYQLMLQLKDTLSSVYWDVVVFDEAHSLKNRHSMTHKSSRLLTRKSASGQVWFLTGTPVSNAAEDYWPLLRAIAPGFGSYWNYASKYCEVQPVLHPRSGQQLGTSVSSIADENDPRVKSLVRSIQPYVLRRTKEQVYPDMPPKVYSRIPVQLDRPDRKLYLSMLNNMRAVLPDGVEVTVDTDLALVTRLYQIATDKQLLYGEDASNCVFRGGKSQALLDLVDSLQGEPFVVFSQWSRVIDMTANRFDIEKITYGKFTGENASTRDNDLAQWREGRTQGLLVTIAAGGMGLDFTHASTAIFTDRSWNPKANEQAEDRLYRHGQTRVVNVYDLYSESTIEDRVFDALDQKTDVATAIVESLVR